MQYRAFSGYFGQSYMANLLQVGIIVPVSFNKFKAIALC